MDAVVLFAWLWTLPLIQASPPAPAPDADAYVGSGICRECHAGFHSLWSSSWHGRALRASHQALAEDGLALPSGWIGVFGRSYRVTVDKTGDLVLLERNPAGIERRPIAWVVGGKNVLYGLVAGEGGRWQTAPVGYDVAARRWFDVTRNGLRHGPDTPDDVPLAWTDPLYCFNTSCRGCHVSQWEAGYDPERDSYQSHWTEPGINCETCHGPAREHVVRARRSRAEGRPLADPALPRVGSFTVEQTNDLCLSCHAKNDPIARTFRPGQAFTEFADLVALEDPDFSPDGRDLGENYTMTTWRQSPCVQSGRLDCLHCHTSSGRYRFGDPNVADQSCMPCHRDHVDRRGAHNHHPPGSVRCVDCHMPTTRFARMTRSDHSMRPPNPAASQRYGSANACTLCHRERDDAWAQGQLQRWQMDTRQADELQWARWIEHGRQNRWPELDHLLRALEDPDRPEIFTLSLVRLLADCADPARLTTLRRLAGQDPSAFIRAAAIVALMGDRDDQTRTVLARALADHSLLVRLRAAAVAIDWSRDRWAGQAAAALDRSIQTLVDSYHQRLDDPRICYNLGNLTWRLGRLDEAEGCFDRALRQRNGFLAARVNRALLAAQRGRWEAAETDLRTALQQVPDHPVVLTNLALLLGQQDRGEEAAVLWRRLADQDPNNAQAAYNLGLLLQGDDITEALLWLGRASRLEPTHIRYQAAYAFYLRGAGRLREAAAVLEPAARMHPEAIDAQRLLVDVYQQLGLETEAVEYLDGLLAQSQLGPAIRRQLAALRNEILLGP